MVATANQGRSRQRTGSISPSSPHRRHRHRSEFSVQAFAGVPAAVSSCIAQEYPRPPRVSRLPKRYRLLTPLLTRGRPPHFERSGCVGTHRSAGRGRGTWPTAVLPVRITVHYVLLLFPI